jgi:DNA-binding response OmpR family regulator
MTVLLLEDDPDGREALSLAIEQAGARVHACGSAAEARRVMDEVIPDVIVSDIGMPGENGYEFLRTLRARGEARVPAIAITGFASKQDREEAVRSGFDEHVAKPVNVDVLLAKLRAMVRRSGVGGDGGDPPTPAPASGPPSGVIARAPQRQAAGSSPPPGGA